MELPNGFVDLSEKIKGGMMTISEEDSEKYHYPSLYFANAKGLEDLPSKGTATIVFKKVMERKESVSTEEGTDYKYNVELQICGLKPEKDLSEMESSEEDPEDAFDRALSEVECECETEEEDGEMEENDSEEEED